LQKYITTDGVLLMLFLLEYRTIFVSVLHDNPCIVLFILLDEKDIFGVGNSISIHFVENVISFHSFSGI
jgi:hypothetical protein